MKRRQGLPTHSEGPPGIRQSTGGKAAVWEISPMSLAKASSGRRWDLKKDQKGEEF